MKRLLYALTFLLVACSPKTYSLLLETRNASVSGVDMGGKSIAFVYLETDSQKDTTFSNFFSDGFVKGLSTDFSNVPIFSVKDSEGAQYSSKDSLISLVLKTEADVVMLLDKPEFISDEQGESARTVMYVYDSMGKTDSVESFSNSVKLSGTEDMLYSDAQFSGFNWASQFIPRWTSEQCSFISLNTESWVTALYYAENFQWKQAIDIWIEKASSSSVSTRAYAAYDIALAEYIIGDYKLSLEWLNYSDSCEPLLLGQGLRKRLSEKMD